MSLAVLVTLGVVCAAVLPIATEARAPQTPRPPGGVAVEGSNPCARKPRCSVTGPFMAEVAKVSSSRSGNRYVVRTTLRFTNLSDRPIMLGYKARSGSVTDELGNRYANEGNEPSRVSGIGYVTSSDADPQFVLGPGQSRSASFESWLWIYRGTRLGTVWSYHLTIDLLEVLPSRQVRAVREYSVGFTDLTTTS